MKKMFMVLAMLLFLSSTGWAAQFGVALVYATDIGLEWSANTESDLASYNIYRSNVPGVYDSTKIVGGVPAPNVQFIDSQVGDGVWYWVITAVDTSGNESGFSNEVTASLDATPPAPPKNLSIWQKIVAWVKSIFMWFV